MILIKALKMTTLALLLIICVVKCSAMSRSELEEFSSFLEATCQLDLNVKSKGPEDSYDEDELISDNAWEESGKFEGDLILNERQRRLLVADLAEGLSRNGLQDSTKRWPDNELIYYIHREHFTSEQARSIQAGIDDLAQVSCVKFIPYRRGHRDAVVIQGSRRGCFSQVGYQGGYQILNLSGRHPAGRGCFRHGTIVHELLHSLGFYHMHSSPDRDDYIDVHWQNIIKPARHNFRKYNSFAVNDFGVGYDYESVLHYSRKAFSSNGQDTLVPKQLGAEIGQRIGLSQKDVQKLNKMYCDIDFNDSNNADSDSVPIKPTVTKKKSKNKPFDGHGIGYHQGKTVVIKLEPTLELYNLPKFHTFKYFSNAEQLLPQTLTNAGGGDRKMIYVLSKSANENGFHNPTTSKSIIQKKENDEEDFNTETISLSGEEKKSLQNERNNEDTANDNNGFSIVPKELEYEISVEKIFDNFQPQYDPANIYLNNDKYTSDTQLNDYYREHPRPQSLQFKHLQNRHSNRNFASFLPESHTSLAEY